ncbi:triacylglycerol lipase [Bifidobacterium dolichotidis]|uniref:Triacylglycerol lipase n=1 Tax=Bifidobacterium dolichotidis TaxID=2306976 RepID=A0A430FNX4_9BIFI|nr:hypothetical protein [Bifidobacterium dolichotidis]RSX54504.1 triacylglycerol lipase [Bifidobacterium dolichotidis]
MTPEQAKQLSPNMDMISTTFLSHFAQMCGTSKQRFETDTAIPFDGSWFFEPSTEYNPYMAWSAMGICMTGYKNLPSNNYRYIQKTFKNLGCQDIDITSYYHLNVENRIGFTHNVDQVSYAFGHRKIRSNDGQEQELLIMMLRGTSDTAEWLSNSEVADSICDGDFSKLQYHEGFYLTASKAFRDLKTYVEAHNVDMSQAKLWVIGHSRGAAVANMLAAIIDEDTTLGVTQDRFYAYTFSASRVTLRKDYNAAQFSNIFNVLNPEDYIPRLPPYGWGTRRFGTDLYLPSIATRYADYRTYLDDFLTIFKQWTHTDFPAFHGNAQTNMLEGILYDLCPDAAHMYQHKRFSHAGTLTFAQYFTLFTDLAAVQGREQALEATKFAKYGMGTFKQFLDYFIHNEILGHTASGAHQEEGYLLKLALICKYNIDIEQGATPDVTCLTINGPADVTVHDADGKTVASIVKGKIDTKLYDSQNFIAMYVNDDTQAVSVWVPNEGNYTVTFHAHDKADFTVTESALDPEGHVLSRTVFHNVPLEKNKDAQWNDVRATLQGETVDAADLNALNVTVKIQGKGKLHEDEAFESYYEPGAHSMPIPVPNVICDARGHLAATKGDTVAVHAHHGAHSQFIGWYTPDAKPGQDAPLSRKETYVFAPEQSCELEAWFERR